MLFSRTFGCVTFKDVSVSLVRTFGCVLVRTFVCVSSRTFGYDIFKDV